MIPASGSAIGGGIQIEIDGDGPGGLKQPRQRAGVVIRGGDEVHEHGPVFNARPRHRKDSSVNGTSAPVFRLMSDS